MNSLFLTKSKEKLKNGKRNGKMMGNDKFPK